MVSTRNMNSRKVSAERLGPDTGIHGGGCASRAHLSKKGESGF